MINGFKEYQTEAAKTAVYPKDKGIEYTALGLVGEAGEVANKVKKIIRDRIPITDARANIASEIGDVLWYCAMLAKEMGIDFDTIATENINKLKSRAATNKLHGSGDNR